MCHAKLGLLWEARLLVDVQLKIMIIPQKATALLVYADVVRILLRQQHLHRRLSE